MRLNEVFDTEPTFVPNTNPSNTHKTYRFDADGQPYFVGFDYHGDNNWEMSYGYDGKMGRERFIPNREKGSAVKVLATVVSYLIRFIDEQKPQMISFDADPAHGLDRLYKAMAKNLAHKLAAKNYKIAAYEDDGITNFIIVPVDAEIIHYYKEL